MLIKVLKNCSCELAAKAVVHHCMLELQRVFKANYSANDSTGSNQYVGENFGDYMFLEYHAGPQ